MTFMGWILWGAIVWCLASVIAGCLFGVMFWSQDKP